MDILKNNLANINFQTDLFGGETPKMRMADRIGFVPISIWRPDWEVTKSLKKIVGDNGESRFIDESDGGQWVGTKTKYNTQDGGLGGNKGNNVSIFNPHLAQMILSAYCPAAANIFDPFGGGGTRGFIASAMGHRYTGIEIRQAEVDRIKEQQRLLNTYFDIICEDSCLYPIKDEEFDFSYTCPPYYDLEVYSNLEGDMSNAESYNKFLELIKKSLEVTYKGLKSGQLAVWVVGNFRDKHGYLTHFNGDTIRLAGEVGFKLHDELIFWGASNAAAQRAGQFEANRKSVRVHEYIIVFKKP